MKTHTHKKKLRMESDIQHFIFFILKKKKNHYQNKQLLEKLLDTKSQGTSH